MKIRICVQQLILLRSLRDSIDKGNYTHPSIAHFLVEEPERAREVLEKAGLKVTKINAGGHKPGTVDSNH